MVRADFQVVDPDNGLLYSGEVSFCIASGKVGCFPLKDPVDQGGRGPEVKTKSLHDDDDLGSHYLCEVHFPCRKLDLIFFFGKPKEGKGIMVKNAIVPLERGQFSPWMATLNVQ